MDIERNVREVERRIAQAADRAGRSPGEVTIVAVTKGVAPDAIEAALGAGIRHIGENRVQEALTKIEVCGATKAEWHFIGHLQRNKVKKVLGKFSLINSLTK